MPSEPPVPEVRFYHLQRKPLERALPEILQRVLDRGWRGGP